MKKIYSIIPALFALFMATSCVNEWPHPEDRTYDVKLLVRSHTDWLPNYEMTYGRADGYEVLYQFRIYPAGNISSPIKEFNIYSRDLQRSDFTVDLSLNPGSYDVYVWSDICNSANNKSLFYDSSDFAAITYLKPYEGDSDYKDAFRGKKSFTIENSMYLHPTATEVIELERPLARYIFVATDLADFIDEEQTRGRMRSVASRDGDLQAYLDDLDDVLGDYTVKVNYPLYMPSVFDNFTNKPIDSWTGISFEGNFYIYDENQAQIGMDYVMVNEAESYVQVSLDLYDSTDNRIGGTSMMTLPLLRDRTTIVYGRFLTSDENAGVSIDPNFKGAFNIEYK